MTRDQMHKLSFRLADAARLATISWASADSWETWPEHGGTWAEEALKALEQANEIVAPNKSEPAP